MRYVMKNMKQDPDRILRKKQRDLFHNPLSRKIKKQKLQRSIEIAYKAQGAQS